MTEPQKTPEDILRDMSEWCRNGTRDGIYYPPPPALDKEQTARAWEGQ